MWQQKRPMALWAAYREASLQSTAVMGSPPLYSSENRPPSKFVFSSGITIQIERTSWKEFMKRATWLDRRPCLWWKLRELNILTQQTNTTNVGSRERLEECLYILQKDCQSTWKAHLQVQEKLWDSKRVQEPPPETAHVGDGLKRQQGYILPEPYWHRTAKPVLSERQIPWLQNMISSLTGELTAHSECNRIRKSSSSTEPDNNVFSSSPPVSHTYISVYT